MLTLSIGRRTILLKLEAEQGNIKIAQPSSLKIFMGSGTLE
jgi:hypothetical protein